VKVAPQHLLSISRVLLGGFVLVALLDGARSAFVLPAVLAACAADYADGIVARRRGDDSLAGRLLDNVCDAAFLALAFGGFACARVFTADVVHGSLGVWLDWLPLLGLALSFGSYLSRWASAYASLRVARRSAFGHRAGVLNYGLAICGGAAVWPQAFVAPTIVTAFAVAVAGFNLLAGLDNLRLLARGE
jgi:phosphatidylglycerophosphate synthase